MSRTATTSTAVPARAEHPGEEPEALPDLLPAGDPRDLVVLLDDDHRAVGTAPREGVHGTGTPLHLAFSCWLLDDEGRVLVTRRALGKRSWPGVWTNSFCGHPRPGEALGDAVRRHGRSELGLDVEAVTPLLPDFAYRAVDAGGVVENEFCPVFTARTSQGPTPNPDEVAELAWVRVDDLRTALAAAPWALSPWLREQAAALDVVDGWSHLSVPSSVPNTGPGTSASRLDEETDR